MKWIEKIANTKKPIIGMIHLPPLPGNPRNSLSPEEIVDKALNDARILVENGIHAIMIENFYDSPYPKYTPREETISLMSIITWEIKKKYNKPIGINILRNCGTSALAIAYITNADFIRVNALSQTMVTDQGIIEPIAYKLSIKQKLLGAEVKIMADINVKHAKPLVERELSSVIRETIERGHADAIIITGKTTGTPPTPEEVIEAKKYTGQTPMVIGSGITKDNLHKYIPYADAFIIGSYFKNKNGKLEPRKIKSLIQRHRELLQKSR